MQSVGDRGGCEVGAVELDINWRCQCVDLRGNPMVIQDRGLSALFFRRGSLNNIRLGGLLRNMAISKRG